MGRHAAGVRGISLREDEEVVSMEILDQDLQVLHVTNKGIGKRIREDQYRKTIGGGKGIVTCKLSDNKNSAAERAVTGRKNIIRITQDSRLSGMQVEGVTK